MTNKIYNILRQSGRHVILSTLGQFRKPANSIHILNGHMSHRTKPDISYFENLMYKLSKEVTFIRIEDAVDMIMNGTSTNKPLVAFTFDDGFAECKDTICPVLEKYGVNGLFFINPNYVSGDDAYIGNFDSNIVMSPGKQPLRWNDLREMHKNGHLIGAHTMDHYMINDDDDEKLEYEIGECKKIIENEIGSLCEYFAFPYGRMEHANPMSIDIACKYYKYVFSQSDYKHYFSFNGRVINRRHFEPFWPISHVNYFLSFTKH
jgi:peptidoglycan/xylan/chitin deacetylase (PgdA/CDA1 family)